MTSIDGFDLKTTMAEVENTLSFDFEQACSPDYQSPSRSFLALQISEEYPSVWDYMNGEEVPLLVVEDEAKEQMNERKQVKIEPSE